MVAGPEFYMGPQEGPREKKEKKREREREKLAPGPVFLSAALKMGDKTLKIG